MSTEYTGSTESALIIDNKSLITLSHNLQVSQHLQ